ncbi:FAD-dependent oxidoreductase [Pedobacter yonginense]|uniref:FAD-dependent oxidoreductase n=1 Tax=Pedobacter yonginense TaxID=651869 RepID=A0A317ET99_9SPHI|nr:FAD-dependent oxidoreductase [Pedobacter yonginense]PWS28378.1 FAD-dependent oxidoreductase [Pedobacter yonginense]
MSGQTFYKGSLTTYLKRRSFLLRVGLITGGIIINGCLRKIKSKYDITGNLSGPNSKVGHLLRDKSNLPDPTVVRQVKTLIIGSGISGLSAARWLQKSGEEDFEIIELEKHPGGNSHFGTNQVSSYPLGAHYITVANNEDELLIDFLKETNVITHFENEIPYYNDYFLTFDPEERLLINGEWQDGLIPDFGLPDKDKQQIKDFLALATKLKNTKGSDGKFVFNIPISSSSTDQHYRDLDKITFKKYLQEQGYTSKYLLWYLNYACKDDYGQQLDKISAWAGLHYFSSRRGTAVNAEQNAVLTWPEGNGWLMKQLAQKLSKHIKTSTVCCEINYATNGNIVATVFNALSNITEKIEAKSIILASPQFVNNRLIKNLHRPIDYSPFNYSPWLIANITLNRLPQSKGRGLCWDNVAYDTPSVGYVNSAQQHLEMSDDKKVLTYYLPLCDFEPAVARLAAYSRNYEQWLDIVIPELEIIHPGITQSIEKIDFWVWGHGMIAPGKDFIWSENLEKARTSLEDKVFFAHSDLSGISIFEEAFHQGINAAKQVLNANG